MTTDEVKNEKIKVELKSYLDENEVGGAFMYADSAEEAEHNLEDIGTEFPAGFTVEYLDGYGGEDQGSDYYSVFSFEKDGVKLYVKFEGWYASFNGADYSHYSFVTPKEKTVIVYE